jgi:hypothetical protein
VVCLIENILCWVASANSPRTRSERKFVRLATGSEDTFLASKN